MFSSLSRLRISPFLALAMLSATALFFAVSESVDAADFTVTKTADTADGTCDADCSLREAITAANAAVGADTLTLPAGTYTLSIAGAAEDLNATGDLDITETLTMNGAGSATTIIDGGDIDRVLNTTSGTADLTLNSVTVQNGDAGASNGGGVQAAGALTLNDSTLTSNEGDQGAGIEGAIVTLTNSHVDANVGTDQGAGIWSCCAAATFTITDSTVDNNIGGDQGAGVFHCCGDFDLTITNSSVSGNQGADQGGGVFFCCSDADVTMTITGSTIDNNLATDQGGGIFFCCGGTGNTAITIADTTVDGNSANNGGQGGGFFYCCGGDGADTITISNSSFSGNDADSDGGGIYICCEATGGTTTTITGSTIANNTTTSGGTGGGMYVDGAASIVNSTIHGNVAAADGGGIYCGSATLSLTNVTITGNTTQVFDSGGGVFCDEFDALNTIIAGNVDTGGVAPDCSGTLNSLGNNLIQDTTGCTIAGDTTGNITGVDPELGALADNGGLTQTRAVDPGTPAYNAGRNTGCPGTDQRGVARPQVGTCDIGAYEFQVVTPAPSTTPTSAPAALPPTGGPAGEGASQAWLIALAALGLAAVAGFGTLAVARRRG